MGIDVPSDDAALRQGPAGRRVHSRVDHRIGHRKDLSWQRRKSCAGCSRCDRRADRRRRRRKAGALTLRIAVHPAWPARLGRGRRVLLAVKISTDAHEADVRGGLRTIGLNVEVALDLAEPSQAGPRIRLAMEIAFDQGVRPLKAVRPAGARLDMQISLDGDIALEQHGAAVDRFHLAADRRWFAVLPADKPRAVADLHLTYAPPDAKVS